MKQIFSSYETRGMNIYSDVTAYVNKKADKIKTSEYYIVSDNGKLQFLDADGKEVPVNIFRDEVKVQGTVERHWNTTLGMYMEHNELPEQLKENYTEEFFKDKFLIVVPYLSSSGSNRIYKYNAYIDEGILNITIKVKIPPIGTCDMAEFVNYLVFEKKDEIAGFVMRIVEEHSHSFIDS